MILHIFNPELVLIGGGDFLCFSDKAIHNSFVFRMVYDNLNTLI